MEFQLVSVIVPIYNSDQYLHRCVDSIINQTFKDLEVLLIDDGSTDKSGKICDEYAEKDKRVRVFHKENGGVCSARNLGLKKAKGAYIAWCDSDDWIELDMFEKMYNKAKEDNADIVYCDYTKVFVLSKEYVSLSYYNIDKTSLLRAMLVNDILGSLWNRLTKRELFENFTFIPNANMAEDLAATVIQIDIAKCISYVPESFYNYDLSNDKSLTKYYSLNKAKEMVTSHRRNYQSIEPILKRYELHKECLHTELDIIMPLLELDTSESLICWQRECNLSLLQIIKDRYTNKGYRLKYCLAKLNMYDLWKRYVKFRQWLG